jgi:ABC-type amino acid transport system permease subunit
MKKLQKILIVLLLFLFLLPTVSVHADDETNILPSPSVTPEPSVSAPADPSSSISDPLSMISLTVVGDSGKIYKLKQLTGSGELVSMSEVNTISFVFQFSKELPATKIVYSVNGGTPKETTASNLSVLLLSEKDYGDINLGVYDKETGALFAEYTVTVTYRETGKIELAFWKLVSDLHNAFVAEDRYVLVLRGLAYTLLLTLGSGILGLVIGTLVASVRSTYDKNEESYKKKGGAFLVFIKILNGICKLYLTVIRGTPVVCQLLIFSFVIFSKWPTELDILIAVIAFGINSGAYVAEIFRGGIMAIDHGQFEAGRSLGFNYVQTMIYIIIPQMFKATLPTLCNEFITLLKETSIAGYVGVTDLTKAGDRIRGATFSAFLPLISVALIYLILVMFLTKMVEKLEVKLRKSER